MGARILCPRCKGARAYTTGKFQVDCGVCNGRGWLELPVDQIVDALKPHIAAGFNLLKQRLIAYAQEPGVRKAIENSLKKISRR